MDSLLLLAWVYMTTGVEPQDKPLGFEHAVVAIARTRDILEPNEDVWYACIPDMYQNAYGAPYLDILNVLPPNEWLESQVVFGMEHMQWLRGQQAMYPQDKRWSLWVERAEKLIEAYQEIINVRQQMCYPDVCGDVYSTAYLRGCLKRAELVMGQDIRLGIVPPVVPVEFFRRP